MPSLREHIKISTRPLHDQLDSDALSMALMTPGATTADYERFLRRTLGFVTRFESVLTTEPLRSELEPYWSITPRARLIRQDLRSLGVANEAIDQIKTMGGLPAPESVAMALGYCYVLEGSAMGGLVLAKQVAKNAGIGTESTRYFLPCSPKLIVSEFTQFCEVLDNFASCECCEREALAGADIAFRAIIRWFQAFD